MRPSRRTWTAPRPITAPRANPAPARRDIGRGQAVTFWVYSAADGYSNLAFRYQGPGSAQAEANGLPLSGRLAGASARGWPVVTDRVYLSAGVNKIVVSGVRGEITLDKLTVTAFPQRTPRPALTPPRTKAEDGALIGTAHVDNSYSQANGGVVSGIGGGPANSLTFTVPARAGGTYAMTVRFANNQQIIVNHYNPDLMTAPADISINGGPPSASTSPARSAGTSSGT